MTCRIPQRAAPVLFYTLSCRAKRRIRSLTFHPDSSRRLADIDTSHASKTIQPIRAVAGLRINAADALRAAQPLVTQCHTPPLVITCEAHKLASQPKVVHSQTPSPSSTAARLFFSVCHETVFGFHGPFIKSPPKDSPKSVQNLKRPVRALQALGTCNAAVSTPASFDAS